MPKQREKQNKTLWLRLGCGLARRLVLALVTEGYPYDMSCFVAWGDKPVSYTHLDVYKRQGRHHDARTGENLLRRAQAGRQH